MPRELYAITCRSAKEDLADIERHLRFLVGTGHLLDLADHGTVSDQCIFRHCLGDEHIQDHLRNRYPSPRSRHCGCQFLDHE